MTDKLFPPDPDAGYVRHHASIHDDLLKVNIEKYEAFRTSPRDFDPNCEDCCDPVTPCRLHQARTDAEVGFPGGAAAPCQDFLKLLDEVQRTANWANADGWQKDEVCVAARSRLENLFLEQQERIELAEKIIFEVNELKASPDQDFGELIDRFGDLISDGQATVEESGRARQSLVDYVAQRHQCYVEVLEEYKASEAELSALKEDALTKEEATEVIDWLPVDADYLDSHPVIESARTKIFRVARRISSSGGNKE